MNVHRAALKAVGLAAAARSTFRLRSGVRAFSADEFDADDGITVDMVVQANAANRRRYFFDAPPISAEGVNDVTAKLAVTLPRPIALLAARAPTALAEPYTGS